MIRLLVLEAIADMAENVCQSIFWKRDWPKGQDFMQECDEWDRLAADTRKVILSCYGIID